jgi:acyl-CoA hydrolase
VSLKDKALRAAVLKALVDLVKDESDQARVELHEALDDTGAASVKVTLPSGEHVATVTLAGGKPTARVTDERAFLSWVQANHPSEVEQRVRDTYRKRLLDHAAQAKAPVDENGEVVPGVEITTGTAYVSQRFATGGRDAIASAWRAGELPEPLLAIGGAA